MNAKKITIILISVTICIMVGIISGSYHREELNMWYPMLNKSILTPPDWVFPVVWSILYLFMGLSAGLLLITDSEKNRTRNLCISLFIIQLALNFAWSYLFFYLKSPFISFIDILLIDLFVILYAVKVYSINKISSMLFIPYILWVLFATYLNGYISLNN